MSLTVCEILLQALTNSHTYSKNCNNCNGLQSLLQFFYITEGETKMKASKNLTKHLKLLKEETDRLISLKRNGYVITSTELNDYLTHKRFIKEQLKIEKVKYFNSLIQHKQP